VSLKELDSVVPWAAQKVALTVAKSGPHLGSLTAAGMELEMVEMMGVVTALWMVGMSAV
jgi:hypothetical protein